MGLRSVPTKVPLKLSRSLVNNPPLVNSQKAIRPLSATRTRLGREGHCDALGEPRCQRALHRIGFTRSHMKNRNWYGMVPNPDMRFTTRANTWANPIVTGKGS